MRGRSQRLWIDLETTGLDRGKHGVIQIAGTIEIEGRTHSTFNYQPRLIRGDKISREALDTHGVTVNQIRKYEPAKDVFRRFVFMLRESVDQMDKLDKFTMFGYNANFDYQFLLTWWEKNHSPYFGSYIWYPPIDVMTLAGLKLEKVRHELRNFKLKTVAAYLGAKIDHERLHDAEYDIELTRFVFHALNGDTYDLFDYQLSQGLAEE